MYTLVSNYHSHVKENLAPWRKLILVVLDYPWIEMNHNIMLWWKENAHRTKETSQETKEAD